MTTAPTIATLCDAVDSAPMMAHLTEFARRTKLSGSPSELQSFAYLQSCLEDYGLQTKLIKHEAYISLPGPARLEVGDETPNCITHSFSQQSRPGGVGGSLVYVGQGRQADFDAADVRGRVAVLEGIANPAASLRASQAGALGQLHI
ncbi:MAG: aminopeptidase, partial [Oxalobacteraceae bacterium]